MVMVMVMVIMSMEMLTRDPLVLYMKRASTDATPPHDALRENTH